MVIREKEHRFFSWKWFVGLVLLAVFVYVVWFFFFSYAECKTWDCFNNKLEDCSKVKFIGEVEMIHEYTVEGVRDGRCEVRVELLQGELNNQESQKLEGLSMVCSLPNGVITIPEKNIGDCTGELKEGLQDLIINRLHSYLVKNLGRLQLELADIPSLN